MNKREKIFLSIIGIGLVLGIGLSFKAYKYREKLIETKKIVIKKDVIIAEKDRKILESVKTGYEAFVRVMYLDTLRTYSIRHPFGVNEPDFQLALNKAQEAEEKYGEFLDSLGYKDGKLTKIIDSESKDFMQISDKRGVLHELMSKEDERRKK